MRDNRILVVLASPSDVQGARNVVKDAVDRINGSLQGMGHEIDIQLARWETAAGPGMHNLGPQGILDERLRIEECDAIIGVFWKRFGTPIGATTPDSGTAHEIRLAISSWKRKGTPQVMLYFSKAASAPPDSVEEADQLHKLQRFKEELLSSDPPPLVGYYENDLEFSHLIYPNLYALVLGARNKSISSHSSASSIRASLSAQTVVARLEGFTELVGDLLLRITCESDVPYEGSRHCDLRVALSAPITSRIIENRTSEIVLREVGTTGDETVILGTLGPPGSSNMVTFWNIPLNVAPHETLSLKITNIRCDCTAVPPGAAGVSPLYAYVTMTDIAVEPPQRVVAMVANGMCSSVAIASPIRVKNEQLGTDSQGAMATLNFTENFAGAFKSRASHPGLIRKNAFLGKALTGESAVISAIVGIRGDAYVAGLADCGTRFQADFEQIPSDVRLFVSVNEYGTEQHARLLDTGCMPGGTVVIAGTESREVSVESGRAVAIWEVVTTLFYAEQPGNLSFVVIAMRSADGIVQTPPGGEVLIVCSLSPKLPSYSSSGPIPQFSSSINVAVGHPVVLPIV